MPSYPTHPIPTRSYARTTPKFRASTRHLTPTRQVRNKQTSFCRGLIAHEHSAMMASVGRPPLTYNASSHASFASLLRPQDSRRPYIQCLLHHLLFLVSLSYALIQGATDRRLLPLQSSIVSILTQLAGLLHHLSEQGVRHSPGISQQHLCVVLSMDRHCVVAHKSLCAM